MNVTVIDGDPRAAVTPLSQAIETFARECEAKGDLCLRLRAAEMRIAQCMGCFDCWLKTPGVCRLKDDGPVLHRALATADLIVFASPLRMGFTSALLKRATDRMVPTVLPYIHLVDGECHHLMRYGRGFDVALMIERGDGTDAELDAVEQVYRRLAKNVNGSFAWLRVVGAKEGSHALHAA